MTHIPVLLDEVVKYLNPKPNQNLIDCTIGGAGHARAILDKTAPNGKLLGIDGSADAIVHLKKEMSDYGNRLVLVHGNFRDLKKIAAKNDFNDASGILIDLGFSSDELADPKLGLSFQIEGPLDMSFLGEETTAAEIVNSWPEKELTRIFRDYGEERFALQIAKAIVRSRKKERILTTLRLVSIIYGAVPRSYERGRIHPATRVFQALRVEVNQELDNLTQVLPQAVDLLKAGGRLTVISFHSLEDRIVKRFFREQSKQILRILTKRPVQAGEEEEKRNPRARSAKLRVAEKV